MSVQRMVKVRYRVETCHNRFEIAYLPEERVVELLIDDEEPYLMSAEDTGSLAEAFSQVCLDSAKEADAAT